MVIMALETPEMMNKNMLEQQRDSDWPNEIFTDMWEQVLADELPDNDIREMEMEMDDDLESSKSLGIRIPRNF